MSKKLGLEQEQPVQRIGPPKIDEKYAIEWYVKHVDRYLSAAFSEATSRILGVLTGSFPRTSNGNITPAELTEKNVLFVASRILRARFKGLARRGFLFPEDLLRERVIELNHGLQSDHSSFVQIVPDPLPEPAIAAGYVARKEKDRVRYKQTKIQNIPEPENDDDEPSAVTPAVATAPVVLQPSFDPKPITDLTAAIRELLAAQRNTAAPASLTFDTAALSIFANLGEVLQRVESTQGVLQATCDLLIQQVASLEVTAKGGIAVLQLLGNTFIAAADKHVPVPSQNGEHVYSEQPVLDLETISRITPEPEAEPQLPKQNSVGLYIIERATLCHGPAWNRIVKKPVTQNELSWQRLQERMHRDDKATEKPQYTSMQIFGWEPTVRDCQLLFHHLSPQRIVWLPTKAERRLVSQNIPHLRRINGNLVLILTHSVQGLVPQLKTQCQHQDIRYWSISNHGFDVDFINVIAHALINTVFKIQFDKMENERVSSIAS